MSGPGVLWIVQDGILMGPGASQTVPYATGLARRGFSVSLLSVEKERFLSDADRVAAADAALADAGVSWRTVPYGTGPGAPRTARQLLRTRSAAREIVAERDVDLVHARSYLPALVALGTRRPFVFDMRGLWPRERVDGGLWREGSAVHRGASRLETVLLRRAAAVVLLADAARALLPPIEVPSAVIPTSVDLERFRPGLPPPAGAAALAGREVFVLAGALGTWYLTGESLDLLALAVRERPRSHVLVLTEEDAGPALAGLAARGVPADRITAASAAPAEVPAWFALGAAGILLVRSAPSKRASMPTKLGEFLACGVPVLMTPGIGDAQAWLEADGAGAIVRDLSAAGYRDALARLDALAPTRDGVRERCRAAAAKRLALASAIAAYADLYRRTLGAG